MNATHVVGGDPGLVHTGAVRMVFLPENRPRADWGGDVYVQHEAIAGPNAYAFGRWIKSNNLGIGVLPKPHIFIEGYKPRSHFGTDERMTKAVHEMRAETNGTVLLNTGVKKVVKQPLLELIGCWKFSTVTHHQDLRSAARIAVLGMLKDEHLNKVLTEVVKAHLAGRTWRVHHA